MLTNAHPRTPWTGSFYDYRRTVLLQIFFKHQQSPYVIMQTINDKNSKSICQTRMYLNSFFDIVCSLMHHLFTLKFLNEKIFIFLARYIYISHLPCTTVAVS